MNVEYITERDLVEARQISPRYPGLVSVGLKQIFAERQLGTCVSFMSGDFPDEYARFPVDAMRATFDRLAEHGYAEALGGVPPHPYLTWANFFSATTGG